MRLLPKLPKLVPQNDEQQEAEFVKGLMRQEAKIGAQLFGPLPAGHHRDFFCLDEHTWIWYEEWTTAEGKRQMVTTRYDVRPNGVLKSHNGQLYQQLSRDEARNLYRAAELYSQRVGAMYQRMLPA